MDKKNVLFILGGGGHARVCIDIAEKMNLWNDIKILDDNENIKEVLNKDVVGKVKGLVSLEANTDVFVAIGNNKIRKRIFESTLKNNLNIVSLIDPSATISQYATINKGTVIMPNVVINANAEIKENCIINSSSVVEHDCVVSKDCHLSPGSILAGGVILKSNVWIGSNSVIKENISITSNVIIGANSFINKNITKAGSYIGLPIKKIN